MPTVLRIGPYRFGFFSADVGARPHVHVRRERLHAKFWIEPIVELEHNSGFAAHELNVLRRLVEEHRTSCWSSGMTTSVADETFLVRAKRVTVTDDMLAVDLEDGRTISVPLVWYPRLVHGTAAERNKVEIGPFGIHWPDLDEDISIKGLLLGNKSGESPRSLQRWLEHRARGEKVPVKTLPLPDWAKDAAERE